MALIETDQCTHHSQTRRDHRPESRQRQLHSRKAASQPPRLPPPLHLPPSDNLVWLRPQSRHRLSAQWGVLRLRRLIPYLAAIWLASRQCQYGGCIWFFAGGGEGGDQAWGCAAVYVSQLQWGQASDVGCGEGVG